MVCNGNPRQKGMVALGHTHANSLDASSEDFFWVMLAKEGLLVIRADVSNAFGWLDTSTAHTQPTPLPSEPKHSNNYALT